MPQADIHFNGMFIGKERFAKIEVCAVGGPDKVTSYFKLSDLNALILELLRLRRWVRKT
jgi:hypothetical protein